MLMEPKQKSIKKNEGEREWNTKWERERWEKWSVKKDVKREVIYKEIRAKRIMSLLMLK